MSSKSKIKLRTEEGHKAWMLDLLLRLELYPKLLHQMEEAAKIAMSNFGTPNTLILNKADYEAFTKTIQSRGSKGNR